MKRDSRLSNVLHALLHMAERNEPMTSDQLSQCLNTNAVVVRRTMAALREQGLVTSERGHGGGWRLARDLSTVSLGEINRALGEPGLIPQGALVSDNVGCLVEAAVNDALSETYAEARTLLQRRLDSITLADLAADFARRMAERPHRNTDHARQDAS